MRYIIMCGGKYNQFKTPKQLLKVNGEVITERTIRLLRENGIKDIAVSTDNPAFDYLDVPILRHKNKFEYGSEKEWYSSENSWLHAYYPMEEPACYLHGDVYYSPEAIKTIIDTPVKDTMFFCTYDWSDGFKDRRNYKGREPFAYKVENQQIFRKAINNLLKMIDDGVFENGLPPGVWQLYRYLNGYTIDVKTKDWTKINNIFNGKGDYVVINDYTTDIDFPDGVEVLEEWLKK